MSFMTPRLIAAQIEANIHKVSKEKKLELIQELEQKQEIEYKELVLKLRKEFSLENVEG